MPRNNLWKFLFVVAVVFWSLYEIYPPRGSDVALEFQDKALKRDAEFTNIVQRLQELQRANADRSFANLIDAIGTNDITRYFPFFDTKAEMNPNRYILNRLQREAAGRIKLGLDLQGGTSFLVGMQFAANPELLLETFNQEAKNQDAAFTNLVDALAQVVKENPAQPLEKLREAVGTKDFAKYFEDVPGSGGTNRTIEVLAWLQQKADAAAGRERALSQAVEVLRKRVDKFGVAEPIIQPAGSDRILIQLPGLSEADKESALRQIQRAAFLEFRMVHERSRELLDQGLTEPGYEVLKEEKKLPSGAKEFFPYLVKKKAERGLNGKYVKNAFVTRRQVNNQPEIAFNLTGEGAEIFAKVTEEHVGHQLAIVLDGVLYSAPVIRTPILGGSGVIEGDFDFQSANELANVLQNPLEAPVKIIESREVDPSLGKDTIRSAIKASVIGVIAVAGFMLVYYLMAGVVANIALMLNIIILLGIMCYFHTTFTLPGIAGVVLTIGMAVDANVLIYERIREELAANKSIRGALMAGYSKAFGTIFDSNLTTLISSVILIFMGTGPVKGFGVALTIGVSVSMFTALVVTRLIFDWLLQKGWLKSIRMWQFPFLHGTKFDFMRWAVPAFILSWSLILVGNGYGILVRGQKVLGPDFAGGDQQTYTFEKVTDTAKKQALQDNLRKAITALNMGDSSIQFQKDISSGTENLRITTAFDTADKVQKALGEQFPELKFKMVGLDKVGPTVGKEIQKTAILASLLAMFGILVYVAFRYEFSFSVGAVVAIIHDILMTMGWFFLSGRELSAPIVAAVLTIIGFSINDTIVIFDRIREDLKLGVRGTFREIMNQALNQCLSRTIITSGTVFLATLSLYIFGGGVVNDFAFTFLVGIVTGTYSSIYIASALVLWWHRGQRPTLGSGVAMQTAAAPAPA